MIILVQEKRNNIFLQPGYLLYKLRYFNVFTHNIM